jgi:hypothetical protein
VERESLRADWRPENISWRSSTRVLARARNFWCRDPARDDGPFPIAAADQLPRRGMDGGVECFSPLAGFRPVLRKRDARSFLAATLLGRRRRPWEKRWPRQKGGGQRWAQHADLEGGNRLTRQGRKRRPTPVSLGSSCPVFVSGKRLLFLSITFLIFFTKRFISSVCAFMGWKTWCNALSRSNDRFTMKLSTTTLH